jgi:hypothetical protein
MEYKAVADSHPVSDLQLVQIFCRLNEGFASYMEYKGVADSHPDWGIEDQFLIADLHGVMNLDATINSHPIVQVDT